MEKLALEVKIAEAKKILESNLQNVPKLAELARLVGLNETYLKIHFKSNFQNTVFGFVKSRRIEKAKELLLEGEMHVSEIAREVGYLHATHFSAAFKKETGASPKEFVRQIQQHEK